MRNFILVFIAAFASSCITLAVNPCSEQEPEQEPEQELQGITQWGGDTLIIRGDEDWFLLPTDQYWRRIQPLHHEPTITTDTIR